MLEVNEKKETIGFVHALLVCGKFTCSEGRSWAPRKRERGTGSKALAATR